MIHVFEELTDEQAGKLIKHIFEYVNDMDPELKDQILKVCFAPIKAQLKRDLDEWKQTCDRNKRNGNLGGRPPKKPLDNKKTDGLLKKPSGFNQNPKNPSKPDNDTDNDNEKDIVNEDSHNEIFRSLWKNQIWVDQLCIKWKKESKEVLDHLNNFRLECITKEELKETEKDAKTHFINWVKFNPFPEPEKPKGYVYNPPSLKSFENNDW